MKLYDNSAREHLLTAVLAVLTAVAVIMLVVMK